MKDIKINIKYISEAIVFLEKECQKNNNREENEKKLERLINSLSIEDMLKIDEYIYQNNLLTK